ncbi:GIY-YIG nuclease OS=Rhodanobacter lindaniclasticus OX=75310 GN=B1991_13520 PE=4 SV=1 [Rhodanobacter lindaniclasticus]
MDRRQPCVYMLASKKNGVLYIGVTSDLVKRI